MQLGSTDAAKRHKGTIIQRAQDTKKMTWKLFVSLLAVKKICAAREEVRGKVNHLQRIYEY